MTPDQYCQQKAATPGSSLHYSLIFMPQAQRQAITALYAFRAELASVVEETSDPQVALRQLDWWREQVCRIYLGNPEHPVGKALVAITQNYPIPQEMLLEIVDGMQMNFQHARYADFKNLQLYCYRVSGVLSRLVAEICGHTDRATLKFAHDLGIALQLSDIVRNVGEAARHGRIFIPVAELQQFDVPASEILGAKESANFQGLMEFQIQRAETLFDQALGQLPRADRKAQRTSLVLAAISRNLLNEIRDDGYRVLNQRIAITPIRKLWIATRTWLTA